MKRHSLKKLAGFFLINFVLSSCSGVEQFITIDFQGYEEGILADPTIRIQNEMTKESYLVSINPAVDKKYILKAGEKFIRFTSWVRGDYEMRWTFYFNVLRVNITKIKSPID